MVHVTRYVHISQQACSQSDCSRDDYRHRLPCSLPHNFSNQNGKFKCTAVALVVLTGRHVGVLSGIREARDTVAPVVYNGIEPDTKAVW